MLYCGYTSEGSDLVCIASSRVHVTCLGYRFVLLHIFVQRQNSTNVQYIELCPKRSEYPHDKHHEEDHDHVLGLVAGDSNCGGVLRPGLPRRDHE